MVLQKYMVFCFSKKCDIMSQSGVLAMNEFTIRSVNRWELKVNLILLAVVFILDFIMGFLSKATSLLLFVVIYQTSYLLTIGWLIALLVNINGYNKKITIQNGNIQGKNGLFSSYNITISDVVAVHTYRKQLSLRYTVEIRTNYTIYRTNGIKRKNAIKFMDELSKYKYFERSVG